MNDFGKHRKLDKETPAFELVFHRTCPSGITIERPAYHEFSHVINADSWIEAAKLADRWDDICIKIIRLW